MSHRPLPRRVAAIAAVLGLLAPGVSAQAAVFTIAESHFESNAEGWSALGGGSFSYTPTGTPRHGFIQLVDFDGTTGPTLYFSAPPAFLGDLSSAYGQKLAFNLWDEGGGPATQGTDLEIDGAEGLTLRYRGTDKPPRKRFKHFQITLKPGKGWTLASTGKRPTPDEFRAALAGVSALLIRADRISGNETASLDDVVLKGKS